MTKKKRQTNPVAVAMKKRYGNTTSVHKDRRLPRGGQKNKFVEYMEEFDVVSKFE